MKRALASLAGLGIVIAVACGSDSIRQATEPVQVVGGQPTVGQGFPGVDRGDGGADASFGPAAPFQVDSFDQQPVQQVDILWVVDNSPSMQSKQDRLKDNIHSFMQFLEQQSIDYHLGVVSTDTYDPAQSGRLQNKAGLPRPWITAADGVNAENDFFSNVGLGQFGTADEKGLLGGMMALTPPLSPGLNANPDAGAYNCARESNGSVDCFLRPDAGLYTVIISDEEDSSCTPVGSNGEGCSDGDIVANGGYGTTQYWSRFYAGVREPAVSKMAAIVTSDDTLHDCATEFAGFCDNDIGTACKNNNVDCHGPNGSLNACCNAITGNGAGQCAGDLFAKSQWCYPQYFPASGPTTGYRITGSWNGCVARDPVDGGVDFVAYTGARYAAVANATGGVTANICDADYTPALEQLGLQASGLRSSFPLSRAPIETSITVTVTTPPSTTPVTVQPGPGTWQYVRCTGSTPTSSIQFTDAARPASNAHVSVSYYVNVRGVGTCP